MKAPAKHTLRLALLTLGLVLSQPGWAARLMAGILKQAGFDVTQASDLGRDSLWATIHTFKGRINKWPSGSRFSSASGSSRCCCFGLQGR